MYNNSWAPGIHVIVYQEGFLIIKYTFSNIGAVLGGIIVLDLVRIMLLLH